MKKALTTSIIILFAANILLSQTKENTPMISNTEKFINRIDAVIEKQFVEIGNLDEIDVRLLKVKDLTSGNTTNAIRLEFQFTNEVQSQTKVTFIDQDEIDILLNALKVYQSTVLKSQKTSNTEVSFLTRSGSVVGCFYKLEKNKWVTYLQLNHIDPKSTVFVENDGFQHLIELLETAKSKL